MPAPRNGSPRFFKHALLFPFALSLLGVAVIALGVLYHRKQDATARWLDANLPAPLMRLRPPHARHATA